MLRRSSHCRDCRRAVESAHQAKRRGAGVKQVTRREIDRLLVEQRNICPLCHRGLFGGLFGNEPYGLRFHIDHKIPVARGGKHVRENLQVTHAKCNQAKGARL